MSIRRLRWGKSVLKIVFCSINTLFKFTKGTKSHKLDLFQYSSTIFELFAHIGRFSTSAGDQESHSIIGRLPIKSGELECMGKCLQSLSIVGLELRSIYFSRSLKLGSQLFIQRINLRKTNI